MAKPWTRPRRSRVRAIRDRLREMYGRPVGEPHRDPIAELTRTILSQHTNDLNRDRAYEGLRERFPTWEEVRDAKVEEVEEAIRPGGLAKQKAPRIQGFLRKLDDPPNLDWLSRRRAKRRWSSLPRFPGSAARRPPACRSSPGGTPRSPSTSTSTGSASGWGCFAPVRPFEEAHDEMLAITDPEDAYELHMNLIRHGRKVCRPQPRCGECELRRMCPGIGARSAR